jgi:uncharacterized membrane protein
MEETGLVLRPYINLWVLLAVVGALAALSVLGYARTTRPVSRWFRLGLLGLRLLTILVLLGCLLRPSMESVHYEMAKRPIVFLVDQSDSMTRIADTPNGLTRLAAVEGFLKENAGKIEKLKESYDVTTVAFARGLLAAGKPDEAATHYSAYGLAMQQAFTDVAESRAEALVVFGDGSQNYGPPDPIDVAAMLNDQSVPVYTVGVGQDVATTELRDIKIVDVQAPKTTYLFATFPVKAQVLFRGCQDQQVKVRMQFPGLPEQERTVKVTHREETVPLEFEATPEEVGEFKVSVTADVLPNEILATNNERSTFVKVVSEGARVGYLDVLRPESKFVTQALEGAKQLRLRRLLALPGRQLPVDETDIERYDVFVLGDMPEDALAPSRLLALKKAVQEEGKGLVVLIGARSGGRQGWRGTPMDELLPVKLAADVQAQEGERRFVVPPGQLDNPIVALRPDRDATAAAWAAMPPLSGALVGMEPKRGATVLASDQDGNPLLVVQRSGAGRVACLTADTTFRWYFTESQTQDDFRLFWRQLVLWASGREEKPTTQLRLELNRQRLMVEEQVKVSVSLVDEDGAPIRDAQLNLTLTDPLGHSAALPFSFSREAGTYGADYAPNVQGDYSVHAEALRDGAVIGTDTARFHATSTNPELEDPIADMKLLRRIAAVTQDCGGRYYHYLQAGDLFSALEQRGGPLKLITRQRRDLWDAWYSFSLLAALMVTEWALRKWKGLV